MSQPISTGRRSSVSASSPPTLYVAPYLIIYHDSRTYSQHPNPIQPPRSPRIIIRNFTPSINLPPSFIRWTFNFTPEPNFPLWFRKEEYWKRVPIVRPTIDGFLA